MHILSPETDNCPSWISGRERMTVENISWSISTKECCRPQRGLNLRPPGLQSDSASNWATEAGHLDILDFFLFGFYSPFKNISLNSSIVGENQRTRAKTTWPSISRIWLSHLWTERGSNHSSEKPNGLSRYPRKKWLNCLQTVQTLIRCCILQVVWVCTVCQLPF